MAATRENRHEGLAVRDVVVLLVGVGMCSISSSLSVRVFVPIAAGILLILYRTSLPKGGISKLREVFLREVSLNYIILISVYFLGLSIYGI